MLSTGYTQLKYYTSITLIMATRTEMRSGLSICALNSITIHTHIYNVYYSLVYTFSESLQ